MAAALLATSVSSTLSPVPPQQVSTQSSSSQESPGPRRPASPREVCGVLSRGLGFFFGHPAHFKFPSLRPCSPASSSGPPSAPTPAPSPPPPCASQPPPPPWVTACCCVPRAPGARCAQPDDPPSPCLSRRLSSSSLGSLSLREENSQGSRFLVRKGKARPGADRQPHGQCTRRFVFPCTLSLHAMLAFTEIITYLAQEIFP